RVLVRRLARVPVMRHIAGRMPKRQPPAPELLGRGLRIVGLGASAGGPAAVISILGKLPKDFPACVVVVQHMLADFEVSYVRFLRTESALPVELATGPTPVRPGVVLVAEGDRHLVASSTSMLGTMAGPPIHSSRPSVDALFESLATHFGAASAGVVLSGIGRDGAAGLLAMRRAGALTIAQDEETSIVFAMPLPPFHHPP